MQRGFALLPVLVVVVLLVVTAGVFYGLGRSSVDVPMKYETQNAPSGNSTGESIAANTPAPNVQWKSVQVEQTVEYFPGYLVSYPVTWNYNKRLFGEEGGSEISITKGENKITITQGAGDGGGCLYGEVKEGMYSQYVNHKEIKKKVGVWRRSQLVNKINGDDNYIICSKGDKFDEGGFVSATKIGWIDIRTPGNSAEILAEVDQILEKISY